MIMKRTRKNEDGTPKMDSPGSPSRTIVTPPKESSPEQTPPQERSPIKELASLPGGMATSGMAPSDMPPSVASPAEEEEESKEQKTSDAPQVLAATATSEPAPKFKSALLQQMLGNKSKNTEGDQTTSMEMSQSQVIDSLDTASQDTEPLDTASQDTWTLDTEPLDTEPQVDDTISVSNVEVEVAAGDGSDMANKARDFVESVVSKAAESMHDTQQDEPALEPAVDSNEQSSTSASVESQELPTMPELDNEQTVPSDEASDLADLANSDAGVVADSAPSPPHPSPLDTESFTEDTNVIVTSLDEDKDIDTSHQATDLLNNYDSHSTVTGLDEGSNPEHNGLVNGYTVRDIEMTEELRSVALVSLSLFCYFNIEIDSDMRFSCHLRDCFSVLSSYMLLHIMVPICAICILWDCNSVYGQFV